MRERDEGVTLKRWRGTVVHCWWRGCANEVGVHNLGDDIINRGKFGIKWGVEGNIIKIEFFRCEFKEMGSPKNKVRC